MYMRMKLKVMNERLVGSVISEKAPPLKSVPSLHQDYSTQELNVSEGLVSLDFKITSLASRIASVESALSNTIRKLESIQPGLGNVLPKSMIQSNKM